MAKFDSILGTVGNTPVVRINRLAPPGVNLFVKIEAFNPLGSVKDRLALGRDRGGREVRRAQAGPDRHRGDQRQHRHRPCHGLRRQGLSAGGDHGGAVQRRAAPADALPRRQGGADARRPGAASAWWSRPMELAKTHGWFLTRQFENEANPDIHSRTTAREIIDDFKGEKLDYWVTGYGTGGTLKGVARVLAKEMPDTKIVAVRARGRAAARQRHRSRTRKPDGSPAAAHPAFKPHPMQGWTPDFIPKLTEDAVDMKVIHKLIHVPGRRRHPVQRRARQEGRHLRRHHRGRHLRRRAEDRRRGAEGRQHPLPCCPTPASAISARRCSPTCRPT